MKCPKCGSENNDSAKFCKSCGTQLTKTINHESMVNNSKGDDTTKYIIIALAIIAIVLAGTFAYLYMSNSNQSNDVQPQQVEEDDDNKTVQAEVTGQAQTTQNTPSSISILGGSFSTGSAEADKTYARINVGTSHAGEDVIVQIFYSRDGNSLNHGNMVPATVHQDGYLEIASADAYHYYPDFATINIYDSNSKLLTTKSVSLSPSAGTQTF